MVSLYRRESASPLHLRDRNRTYTPVKLSKTIVGQSLPSLISRSFRENGSHRFVIVYRGAGDSQECRQFFQNDSAGTYMPSRARYWARPISPQTVARSTLAARSSLARCEFDGIPAAPPHSDLASARRSKTR